MGLNPVIEVILQRDDYHLLQAAKRRVERARQTRVGGGGGGRGGGRCGFTHMHRHRQTTTQRHTHTHRAGEGGNGVPRLDDTVGVPILSYKCFLCLCQIASQTQMSK